MYIYIQYTYINKNLLYMDLLDLYMDLQLIYSGSTVT